MSNRSPRKFRARVLVLSLIVGALGIYNTDSTLAAKNKGVETQAAGAQGGTSQVNGQLIANGPVTINGNKAITGTTVFTESNIAVDCAKGNSAIVNLGALGRIELVAGTKLTLRFSEGQIGGNLTEGKAVISTPAGVKVAVNTPDGVVSSTCAQTQACVTPVVVQGFVQCVPVVSGPVRAPIPVSHGIGGWGIAGIVAGAAAVTGGAVAAANSGETRLAATTVSPVAP
jgi:hypothetical protein